MARGTKFTKTSKLSVGRDSGSVNAKGPRVSGNVGSKVSDGAGTREQAALPPFTKALKAPEAKLPKAAAKMASAHMPVPGVNSKRVGSHEAWDEARDRKL